MNTFTNMGYKWFADIKVDFADLSNIIMDKNTHWIFGS